MTSFVVHSAIDTCTAVSTHICKVLVKEENCKAHRLLINHTKPHRKEICIYLHRYSYIILKPIEIYMTNDYWWKKPAFQHRHNIKLGISRFLWVSYYCKVAIKKRLSASEVSWNCFQFRHGYFTVIYCWKVSRDDTELEKRNFPRRSILLVFSQKPAMCSITIAVHYGTIAKYT